MASATNDNTFIEEGDVFKLEIGMKIKAIIPDCFIYANRKDAPMTELSGHTFAIGQVFTAPDGKGGVAMFDSSEIAGTYLATKTTFDGGSRGSLNANNDYPDGHHVFAQRLDADNKPQPGAVVDFYQSGFFTHMIEPSLIEPIGKMEKSFAMAPQRGSPKM